jgi:hypothetical protein
MSAVKREHGLQRLTHNTQLAIDLPMSLRPLFHHLLLDREIFYHRVDGHGSRLDDRLRIPRANAALPTRATLLD